MTFRRLVERGITHWAVVGHAGAVNLSAMLLPAALSSPVLDAANEALDFVRTDGGWLMPADLGLHRPDPHGGLQRMDDCPWLDGGCWYGGSSLAAWEPFKEWERRGFDDAVLKAILTVYYTDQFDEEP